MIEFPERRRSSKDQPAYTTARMSEQFAGTPNMINGGQKRHVVNDFDCLAAEIAGNLIAKDNEENAMRELWRYLEALHRTLLKSGIREARAWEICSELKGRVVEEVNRIRQLAH